MQSGIAAFLILINQIANGFKISCVVVFSSKSFRFLINFFISTQLQFYKFIKLVSFKRGKYFLEAIGGLGVLQTISNNF